MKLVKPRLDEQHLCRSSEAYDQGAALFTNTLSEELRCLAVMTNFTKLLIDAAKPLTSKELIRHYYKEVGIDGKQIPISFNNQGYRLYERLSNFYLEYHKILNECMDFC